MTERASGRGVANAPNHAFPLRFEHGRAPQPSRLRVGAHYSCHVGPTELLTGHTPENVCVRLPGEEGGVVKTVKGEATVRIEGVAFVYG